MGERVQSHNQEHKKEETHNIRVPFVFVVSFYFSLVYQQTNWQGNFVRQSLSFFLTNDPESLLR